MTTGARKPWTDADIERLRLLHADGLSCGGVASQLGRPMSSVATKARKLGLKWTDAPPPEALAARAKATADVRQTVVQGMYELAGQLLLRVQPGEQFEDLVRGEGGAEVWAKTPRVPTRAARDLASAVGTLARAAAQVEAALARSAEDSEMDRYLDWVAGEATQAATSSDTVSQSQTPTEGES